MLTIARYICPFSRYAPVNLNTPKSKVEACILDINKWMTANKLMLNNDKTELLVLNARHRPPPPLSSIYAGSELIIAAESAKNIGVWFDNNSP